LYNIFNTNSIKTDVKGYKEKIEALQTKVDSAQAVNEKIDVKIDSVKDNVVNITKEIHHIDNNISIIKQQTDEKINSVDSFTANELEQFFTNRYDKGSN
jgi:chromosome segregation ATPase